MMKDGYSFIPGGTTVIDGQTVACQSFFMRKTEVSNFDYKEYLSWLKNNNQLDAYNVAFPDTTKWTELDKDLLPLSNVYSYHSAYRDFPVVNITREQAEKYCDWLSMVWQKNTGNKNIHFRLPLRAEFLLATANSEYHPYAWTGPYLNNAKGDYLCNFLQLNQALVTRNTETGELEILKSVLKPSVQNMMASVKSYYPNVYGLYNLNGNVSEMVQEQDMVVGGDWFSGGHDVRNESYKYVNGASPLVGFRPVMTYTEDSYRK
ncbi:MAG: formylglycine-generating enzyme family protein [Crocinitomicaceae bacterium]|nr:formylglycine-generating enzyme family protein [Crocinitomicaceae bacterium]